MKTKGRSNKLELTALQEGIILMIKQKKKRQKISLSEIEAFRRACRVKYRSISEKEITLREYNGAL